MTYFPYNQLLQTASGADNNFDKFTNGNFGFWFNKFVPLKSERDPKPSNFNGDDNKSVEYYKEKYTVNADDLLHAKHLNQFSFCKTMESLGYQSIVFHAKLKTPLITGIGETHPHEIGMTFDHTIGVPYIPASGIKGVSRLNFIIENIKEFKEIEEKENIIDLESNKDFIKSFGTGDKRGNIIFLDAYSIKTPKLKADIMTPHYPKYYNDGEAPADNQDPNPIKFLTVKEGTEFVFRALVKDADVGKAKEALKKTLENGVGAKTALGYGMFGDINEIDPQQKKWEELQEQKREEKEIKRLEQMSPFEQACFKLKNANENEVITFYKAIDGLNDDEKKVAAKLIKARWGELNKWSGKQSKKQKQKIVQIKQILGEK